MVDDFVKKLSDLASKERSLGYDLEEVDLLKKLLDLMPKCFLQIMDLIEQYFEFDSMLFDEDISILKAYEEHIRGTEKVKDTQGKLMLASEKKLHVCKHCGNRGSNQDDY